MNVSLFLQVDGVNGAAAPAPVRFEMETSNRDMLLRHLEGAILSITGPLPNHAEAVENNKKLFELIKTERTATADASTKLTGERDAVRKQLEALVSLCETNHWKIPVDLGANIKSVLPAAA